MTNHVTQQPSAQLILCANLMAILVSVFMQYTRAVRMNNVCVKTIILVKKYRNALEAVQLEL